MPYLFFVVVRWGRAGWLPLALGLVVLTSTRPARAEDCELWRSKLHDAGNKEGKARCRALRPIVANVPVACRPILADQLDQAEARLEISCRCPDDPKTELERCQVKPDSPRSEQETLQCIYHVRSLWSCDGVTEAKREQVERDLKSAYANAQACTGWGQDVEKQLVSQAKSGGTCDQLNAIAQRRNAIHACPAVQAGELTRLDAAIRQRRAELSCSDGALQARLYRQIQELNRQIKEIPDCLGDAQCRKLEDDRLEVLTDYLELVRVRTPEELPRARALLRGVGTEPSVGDMVARYGDENVRVAASLSVVFNTPALLKKFLDDLRSLDLSDVADSLASNNGTFEDFLRLFRAADAKARQRALSVADSLQDAPGTFQDALEAQQRAGMWEIWFDEPQDRCESCGALLSQLLKYFRNVKQHSASTDAEFDTQLRRRNDACRAQAQRAAGGQNPRTETCGLVLRVNVVKRDQAAEASGKLYFVDGRPTERLAMKPISIPAVVSGKEEQAVLAFARAVAAEVSTGLPPFEEPPAPPTPSKHCGVRITYSPDFKPAPFRKGLQIQSACGHRELTDKLVLSLLDQPPVGVVTTVDLKEKPKGPYFTFEDDISGGVESCVGALHDDSVRLYSIMATVDPKEKCGTDESGGDVTKRWAFAGEDIAAQIVSYYTQPNGVVVDARANGPRASSAWYAIAFAGAPYLGDSRAATWSKVVPSVLDLSLLVGAGVSYGMAVKLRNDYANGDIHSTRPSERALSAAFGLVLGLAGVRGISAAGYAWTDWWMSSEARGR